VGLQATHGSDQLQGCAHSAFCVVLVSLGVSKVNQNPVAHVLRYEATEALHGLGNTLLVAADNLAKVLRVHAGREGR
jgi:hypothetical protein